MRQKHERPSPPFVAGLPPFNKSRGRLAEHAAFLRGQTRRPIEPYHIARGQERRGLDLVAKLQSASIEGLFRYAPLRSIRRIYHHGIGCPGPVLEDGCAPQRDAISALV